MSDKITNLNGDSFKETIQSASAPVLVDFWAPWCGPCRSIAPILEELAEELDGKVQICKVNIDDEPNGDIAAEFGVRAIPTLLLFKDGKVVEQVVGLTNKDELKSTVTAHT